MRRSRGGLKFLSVQFSISYQYNRFVFQYDFFGYNRYFVKSSGLPTGKVQLRMDFKYDGGGLGKGAAVTLFVNGRKAAEGRLDRTVPVRFGMDDMDVGMDLGAPVGNDYKPPHEFTGTIEKVTIDLK